MAKPSRIINVHTHLHHDQDLDARLRLWREWNVQKVCIQTLASKPGERFCNDEVAALIQKYPDIIVGFGKVDLGFTPDGPEAIDRLKDQGFTGLKFIWPSYPYDDERYYPLYERAQVLSMPILFHTGFSSIQPADGANRISVEKMRAARLDTIGRAFPKLRMIMAHLGNPEFHVGLDIITEFPNIWAEFSGAGGSKWRETTLRKVFAPLPGANMADPEENQALRWFGKLCFATDNPDPPKWVNLCLRLMDELQIPDDIRERFWWRNAAGVLQIRL
ncbi:MAG: amidohydrolase family protein [Planctomycetota bacterium]